MRIPIERSRLPERWQAEQGLTAAEVASRRERFGANEIAERRISAWRELLGETLRDPMIWFLVLTSVAYLALGDWIEGGTLLVAIVPLVGMDAFLHWRTQASTEGLSRHLASEARALREGTWRRLPALDLVVGDLVELDAGESFPADGLVVSGERLQAAEATLTGESYPVRKRPLEAIPPGEQPAVDAEHLGFAGTRLLTGRARLRITAVGPETVYGQIVRAAVQTGRVRTPLQAAITSLVAGLSVAAAIFCVLLAVVRLEQGAGWIDALVSAATLGVAALPEEFPVAFTFFLGAGVFRLARRHALVRRAVSVEDIGRITCICSDKTGTITEGRLRPTRVAPVPGVTEDALLAAAALATWPEAGDPLDVALAPYRTERARIADFPFTEERRRASAVVERDGQAVAISKGAPERIFEACALSSEARAEAQHALDQLARGGGKVIACAELPLGPGAWHGGEPERGMRLLGLIAFEDPIRAGVIDAVASCRGVGIRPILVTGDHPLTAAAVARELGLGDGRPRVILGEALREADVASVDVIARALPQHKLELVRTLQGRGEHVAVTGDGVNDVPALLAADVGVAMGERGTRSAREVAAIVLLDDNFQSIVAAIAEGRQLFENLRASFAYLLLIHIPLVLTAALVPLAGFPLLYLPIHVVWLELLIHPTAMLAFQARAGPLDHEITQRRARARFFGAGEWIGIGLSGAIATVLLFWGYHRALGNAGEIAHARALAMAFLALLSAIQCAQLSRLRTRSSRAIALATVVFSVALIQLPALSRLLQMSPLHLDDWTVALVGSLAAALPIAAMRVRRAPPQSRRPASAPSRPVLSSS